MSMNATLKRIRQMRKEGRHTLNEKHGKPEAPGLDMDDVQIVMNPNPVNPGVEVRTGRTGKIDMGKNFDDALMIARSHRQRTGNTNPIMKVMPDGTSEMVAERIALKSPHQGMVRSMEALRTRGGIWTVSRSDGSMVGVFEEEDNARLFSRRLENEIGSVFRVERVTGTPMAHAKTLRNLGFAVATDETFRAFGPTNLLEARITAREIELWVANDKPLFLQHQAKVSRLMKSANAGRYRRSDAERAMKDVARTAALKIQVHTDDAGSSATINKAVEQAVDILVLRFEDEHINVTEAVTEQSMETKAALAIMDGQDKIETSRGKKSVQGLAAMIKSMTPQAVADSVLAGDETLQTDFGVKTREGLVDLIRRHKDGDPGDAKKKEDPLDVQTEQVTDTSEPSEEDIMNPGVYLSRVIMILGEKGLPDPDGAVNRFGIDKLSRMRRGGTSVDDAADAVIDDRNDDVTEHFDRLSEGIFKWTPAKVGGSFGKFSVEERFRNVKRAIDNLPKISFDKAGKELIDNLVAAVEDGSVTEKSLRDNFVSDMRTIENWFDPSGKLGTDGGKEVVARLNRSNQGRLEVFKRIGKRPPVREGLNESRKIAGVKLGGRDRAQVSERLGILLKGLNFNAVAEELANRVTPEDGALVQAAGFIADVASRSSRTKKANNIFTALEQLGFVFVTPSGDGYDEALDESADQDSDKGTDWDAMIAEAVKSGDLDEQDLRDKERFTQTMMLKVSALDGRGALSGKTATEIASIATNRSPNLVTAIRRLSFLKGVRAGGPEFERKINTAIKTLSRRNRGDEEVEIDNDITIIDSGLSGISHRISDAESYGINKARAVLDVLRRPMSGKKLLVPSGEYRVEMCGTEAVWLFPTEHVNVNEAISAGGSVYHIRIDSLTEAERDGSVSGMLDTGLTAMFNDQFITEEVFLCLKDGFAGDMVKRAGTLLSEKRRSVFLRGAEWLKGSQQYLEAVVKGNRDLAFLWISRGGRKGEGSRAAQLELFGTNNPVV